MNTTLPCDRKSPLVRFVLNIFMASSSLTTSWDCSDGSRTQYLYTTGYFKRQVILKQQFTIEKGYYDPLYNTPYSEPDGMRVSIIAHSSLTAQNY